MTVDELVDLFFDDETTPGTRSPRIVQQVARQVRPTGLLVLAAEFYPGVPWPEIPELERQLLDEGYQAYRREQK